jgi:predicted Zn-dependent protease
LKFKLWQTALFVVLVVGTTFLIFPTKPILIGLYLQSGELEAGSELLEEQLAIHPDDIQLLLLAADIYQKLGYSDRSLEVLRKAQTLRPRDPAILRKLAQMYEWSMEPDKAAEIYNQMADASLASAEILRKLIAWDRYIGRLPAEVGAIIRLLNKNTFIAENSPSPYLQVLAVSLERLAKLRSPQTDDILLDFLIQRLFILGEQYKAQIQEGETPDMLQWCTYALEYFVMTGRIRQGLEYAVDLDTALGRPLFASLRLVTVLQWSNMYQDALDVLTELDQMRPDDLALLKALADTSRRAKNYQKAENTLLRLAKLAPRDEEVSNGLADLYMEQGAYSKAVDVLVKIAEGFGRTFKLIDRIFEAALAGGKVEQLEIAAEQAKALSAEQWTEMLRSDPDVARKRAAILIALKRPKEALPVLMDLHRQTPDDRPLVLQILQVAGDAENAQLASEIAENALQRWPDDKTILRAATTTALALGDEERALSLLAKLLQMHPDPAEAAALLEVAGSSGKPALVEAAAKTVARYYPRNASLLSKAGEVAEWTNDPGLAYRYYRAAALLSKNESDVGHMLETASYTGNADLMSEALQTAFRLRPDDANLALRAARQFYGEGQPKLGRRIMEQLEAHRRLTAGQLRQWADMALTAGNDDEAYQLLERVHVLAPDDEKITRRLAQLASWTDRYGRQAELLGELSRTHPKDAALALEAAQAFSGAGSPARAAELLKVSLKYAPDNPDLLRAYARFSNDAGRSRQAAEALERLRRFVRLNRDESLLLASALLDDRQPTQALEILEPLASEDALEKDTGLLLIRALISAGRHDRAASASMAMAEQYANDAPTLSRLGVLAMDNARPEAGLRLFDRVLSLHPSNLAALKMSGMALADLGRNALAQDRLNRYLKLRPQDPEARYRLAEALEATGRTVQARQQYAKALQELKKDSDLGGRP